MSNNQSYEETLAHVNTFSSPATLRITDIRFTDINGGPFHSSLIKVYTNQGLVGFGEVRDGGDKVYAQMLKGRLLGRILAISISCFAALSSLAAMQGKGRRKRAGNRIMGSRWQSLRCTHLSNAWRHVP